MNARSMNRRQENGSLLFHKRNERATVDLKTVKPKTRRPENVVLTCFPDRWEDEHTLELHGTYTYGKRY